MKEIFNIFKKYIFSLILMIIFLVFQAILDLKLPDYTSDIVNVGIQQNGIENTTIEVIRESEYEKIKLFLNENEQEKINKNYEYKENNNLYKNTKENIYELKNDNNVDEINSILLESLTKISMLNNITGEQLALFLGNNININENTNFFEIYKTMSNNEKNILSQRIDEKFLELETSIKKQSAIEYIKNEYNILGIDLEHKQTTYILETGLKMLGVAFLSMTIVVLTIYTSSKMATRFSRDLRKKVVKKVLSFSNKEFEDFSSSSLITRSTNDITQIQMFLIMGLRTIIYAPIIGIGAFLKVSQNEMGWVIGVALITILLIVGTLFTIAMPKFSKVQEHIDKLNLVFREILSGLPVIRAFKNENHEEKRFDNANTNLMKINKFVNNVMALMMPLMSFIMNGVTILILWVGADKVDAGTLQVGNLIAFMTYAIQIIISFLLISVLSIMIPRAFISMKRIKEIFITESSIITKENPTKFNKKFNGTIEFRDVYFRYPDANEDVLQNISFIAESGKTTAFIGSTGSGKSTLINLIPRFFETTSGKILIDGINIKDCDLKQLRNKIGYVPQKGLLFSGTIESNINFGNKKNLSKKELDECINIAQAKKIIEEKEDGYNYQISQGGTNVSGGQRQRISIARALAINPDIYIFDDSFSALDFKTDASIRKELKKVTKNKTVLIVAQRISTIMHADKIIVLDDGEIVGSGTHKELLKDCKVYQEIVYSQLGKEEL